MTSSGINLANQINIMYRVVIITCFMIGSEFLESSKEYNPSSDPRNAYDTVRSSNIL